MLNVSESSRITLIMSVAAVYILTFTFILSYMVRGVLPEGRCTASLQSLAAVPGLRRLIRRWTIALRSSTLPA
jgi:hypothetical protein